MTQEQDLASPSRHGLLGVVLAAGAGRRMGTPKALLRDPAGTPQTLRTTRALRAAGCQETLVVLGAAADDAGRLLADFVRPEDTLVLLVAQEWEQGIGRSLRAGLEELLARRGEASGVLVTLVDLPDVGPAVYGRVAEEWRSAGARSDALLRATYAGKPGHPVLLGRDHWAPLVAELAGDVGAQQYLARHKVQEVSCEDLATGRDTDRPEDLAVTRVRDGEPR